MRIRWTINLIFVGSEWRRIYYFFIDGQFIMIGAVQIYEIDYLSRLNN